MAVARYWMICLDLTPTDRPKWVRNRCVIKFLVTSSCCLLSLSFSDGMGAFVIGLGHIGPQLLCNRSFWWRFCRLSRYFFYFSVGVGAFVIGLSQISSFFSFFFQYVSVVPYQYADVCVLKKAS